MISITLVVTVAMLVVTSASAQQVSASTMSAQPRLHVRPHAMATGTRTTHAGLQQLAGLPEYYLYIPPQCVGTRRAPMIVLLHGGGRSANIEIQKFRGLADTDGVIVLAANATQPGEWDWINAETRLTTGQETATGESYTGVPQQDIRNIDVAMQYVLRTNAIDPDRIALVGFSDGGSSALFLGRSNQDIFTRVAALSALIPFDGRGPTNPKTQFFLSGGIAENMVPQTLKMAQVLRHEGYPVATLLGLRGHVDYVADEAFVWQWLLQSWVDPRITTRVPMPTDSDPLLTVEAIQHLTTFWTRFSQEPDSILRTGRMAHQVRRWLQLGTEPVSVITTDLPALAAAYSSVAADLAAAGLTASQAMAYHAAVLRVGFARMGGLAPGDPVAPMALGADLPVTPITSTSVLGYNLAFRQAHAALFKTLAQTGFWTTQ